MRAHSFADDGHHQPCTTSRARTLERTSARQACLDAFAWAITPCDSGVCLAQLIRQFTELAAGCNTGDYATVAPPASNFYTYNMAVANSCTDTYM